MKVTTKGQVTIPKDIREILGIFPSAEVHFIEEALFLASKAFLTYRKRRGSKNPPFPVFYIGAQTAVLNMELITRDVSRYRSYFPTVRLIAP